MITSEGMQRGIGRLLNQSLAISQELSMRLLMERAQSRREIVRA